MQLDKKVQNIKKKANGRPATAKPLKSQVSYGKFI